MVTDTKENTKITNEKSSNEIKIDDSDFLYSQISADAENQYVTFTVGREEYGVKILSVQEIVSIAEITYLPNTPPFIRGVINLRGNVIALVDLRVKFGLQHTEIGKNTVVIVVNIETKKSRQKTMGIIVDKVSDVLTFSDNSIQEAPSFSADIDSQFIDKIGKLANRMVILLDITKLLSDEEMQQMDKFA